MSAGSGSRIGWSSSVRTELATVKRGSSGCSSQRTWLPGALSSENEGAAVFALATLGRGVRRGGALGAGVGADGGFCVGASVGALVGPYVGDESGEGGAGGFNGALDGVLDGGAGRGSVAFTTLGAGGARRVDCSKICANCCNARNLSVPYVA